ncbi:hypothetical protein CROQUDRAFT_239748 [Cronartium quercuum f. sp. fusiforme G11]|uniref:Conserved oligomeric Golgi complex subunit 8 n=1 Tax=Cronartium quercuum f. sp. fusiforme G11 TaxID=708437 RepID=A0A9P6NE14_9BASI|nr:hypothetical protein CROQUDRAFT_239748 [Cronartium quercuum f. sp. fusiforme G11]
MNEENQSMIGLNELLIQSANTLKLNLNPDSLNSIESKSYLSKLASLPLNKLNSQPTELQYSANNLESDLSLLCYREFRSFLLAHEASTEIKQTFNKLNNSLNQLLNDSNQLSSSIQNFPDSIKLILKDRKQISLVLSHLSSIEDLLDLPHLIKTCVTAKLWNEAIELAKRVYSLDYQSFGILNQIKLEVDLVLQSLRNDLLNDLKLRNLKLPSAVRNIGVLRKISKLFSTSLIIQSLNEPELRIVFLSSRWFSLTESSKQLELFTGFSISTNNNNINMNPLELFSESSLKLNEERLKFLKRWIENWRELIGDTISIYNEIFINYTKNDSIDNLSQDIDYPSYFLNDSLTPLNFFSTQSINLLIKTLEHHLPLLLTVTSLSSLLTQLSFCSTAFIKWGLDFAGLIKPIFVNSLERLIKIRMEISLQEFIKDLKLNQHQTLSQTPTSPSFERTNFQNRRKSLKPIILDYNRLIAPDSFKQVLSLNLNQLLPPSSTELNFPTHLLLLFTPLAKLINNQFISLNELRLLPIKESYSNLSNYQLSILKKVNEEIQKLLKNLEGLEEGRKIINQFIIVWSRYVLPILERSLRIEIYSELNFDKASQDFLSLLNDAESLINISIESIKKDELVLVPTPEVSKPPNDGLVSPSATTTEKIETT